MNSLNLLFKLFVFVIISQDANEYLVYKMCKFVNNKNSMIILLFEDFIGVIFLIVPLRDY